MKKTKMLKAGLLTKGLAMATTAMVGGTMDRYVTSTGSEAAARVAIWGINKDAVTEFNLFQDSYTNVGNVKDDKKLIAPGTEGEATFSIVHKDKKHAPEVAYKLTVDTEGSEIHEKLKEIQPLTFTLDGTKYDTWEKLLAAIEALDGKVGKDGAEYEAGVINPAFDNGETHTIGWKWNFNKGFEDNENNTDNTLGNLAASEDLDIKLVINVKAEQID